jgi:hypothetical protein
MSLTWWWHRLVSLGVPLWLEAEENINKQGVCHTVALPFTLKKRVYEGKRRIMGIQIFHHTNI